MIFLCSDYESTKSYLIPFASQWPFSAVPMVMAIVLPESPAWLTTNGRLDHAFKSIQRLHTAHIDHQVELARFQKSIEHEKETGAASATYIDCMKGINLRRTGIVAFANTLPVLFGLPLLSQASYFAQTVGMGADNSLIFLILGIGLGLVANGIGIWVMSRVGRRISSIVTLSAITALWTCMGIAGCFDSIVTIW